MKNGEQSAYARTSFNDQGEILTKREYFAAKAMQAMIAQNLYFNSDGIWDVHFDSDDLATEATVYADALLNKLEQ